MPASTATDEITRRGTGKMRLVPGTMAPPTADDVAGLLRGVIDPELGSDIVDLGMATGVDGHRRRATSPSA